MGELKTNPLGDVEAEKANTVTHEGKEIDPTSNVKKEVATTDKAKDGDANE